MVQIKDHPLRYMLANELHARPFPTISSPTGAVYLAIKRAEDAAGRDLEADFEHLTALLDRFGATHPKPGATHWFGQLGKHKLKWEQHTEFVTYTLFVDQLEDRPFDGHAFRHFPQDWLDEIPGRRITSALIRVEKDVDDAQIVEHLKSWFVPESLAVSGVLDGSAVVAGDFRIDAEGHMRFAVFTAADCGERRIGRIVQRLCEIETYKSMSMLGLARVQELNAPMGKLDQELTGLMSSMSARATAAEETLDSLLAISAQLENMLAQSAFRFGATGAYQAIVTQRIDVLREQRFKGRQTFAEFMTRRFDPAMRTVKSTEKRLQAASARALRAGDLLRTRVDVERSAQNQTLLESMDRRADLQLRLQKTVEGLSVVAISYYAVGLVINMLAPLGEGLGLSKIMLTALATPAVIAGVWLMVRRVRKTVEKED